MYIKNYFSKNNSLDGIIKLIKNDGFDPILIKDPPNFIYDPHHHPEVKLIVCLEGSMKVKVKNEEFNFEPGDKLLIPGDTTHSAVAGKEGCVFYWSEKIL